MVSRTMGLHSGASTVSTPHIQYILECKHVMPGGVGMIEVMCFNCDAKKRVTDVHEYEWRCVCRSCNYKPWAGLSQMTARHNARGHSRKHPEHDVQVLYLPNPTAVRVKKLITEGNGNGFSSSSQA